MHMGEIVGSKLRNDGKVVFSLVLNKEEARQLEGNMDKIHIFSENVVDIQTNLAQRGKNGSTKYFLIPTKLRKDLILKNEVMCQRMDTSTKTIFIYIIDKLMM